MEEDIKPDNELGIDLIDEKGDMKKLEVYQEKEEPVREAEVIKVKPKESKEQKAEEPKVGLMKRILNFYDKKYKKLMIIPFAILFLAFIVIGVQIVKTGSFMYKDVSLRGGVTLTITSEKPIESMNLEKFLSSKFKKNDVSVNSVKESGKQIGVIIVSDIDGSKKEELDFFISSIEEGIGFKLENNEYSVEVMGSSLGASFFKETFTALIAAFILMSIVVFIYFRAFIPSVAVVLCAFSDIIVTLAVVDLMGMKLSTGGIAAFLMLVGYSVDTDMLLTTRVLMRKEGSVFDRVMSSVKTGMMMTLTTLGALVVGMIFTESAVIRQIMTIVLIGLIADMIFTWIQNVGILRIYVEKKGVKGQKNG